MFQKFFDFINPNKKGDPSSDRNSDAYQIQKEKLKHDHVKSRISLARDSQTSREILYYLAQEDPDPRVRKEVAGNPSTPLHASPLLAQDKSEYVRFTLARRLLELLPDLSRDQQSHLYAYAVQALSSLALDEVLKIRIALSSTLKDYTCTPPEIASKLAKDVEKAVSEPILRFCVALDDQALLDILSSHPASWVIQAIASRKIVSDSVSTAIIDTNDAKAGRRLIENENAFLSMELLQIIIQKSKTTPEWQKSLAKRQSLPPEAASLLFEFAGRTVRQLLEKSGVLEDETLKEMGDKIERRLQYATDHQNHIEPQTPQSLLQRARKLKSEGVLNADFVADALGMRDYEFVQACIAVMGGFSQKGIETIFAAQSAKSIVAVTWKAGLPMRLALKLQQEMARIPHKDLIYPRAGTDYPFSNEEMQCQIDFLGISA
jgi:uncharacterized protein (DUF2336 family)